MRKGEARALSEPSLKKRRSTKMGLSCAWMTAASGLRLDGVSQYSARGMDNVLSVDPLLYRPGELHH